MSSVATRKAPNAFNFIRQTQVLQRAQSTAVANMASCLHPAQELLKDVQSLSDLQDWSKHADIAKAFQIGKFEAGAVSNLMSNVSEPVRLMVTADVRIRGHENSDLARGVGQGHLESRLLVRSRKVGGLVGALDKLSRRHISRPDSLWCEIGYSSGAAFQIVAKGAWEAL